MHSTSTASARNGSFTRLYFEKLRRNFPDEPTGAFLLRDHCPRFNQTAMLELSAPSSNRQGGSKSVPQSIFDYFAKALLGATDFFRQ